MVIRAALCMVLLAAAAPAQWKRYAYTPQGGIDSPPAHDLEYFKVHPCSRSDRKDRLTYCEEPPSKAELDRRAGTRTNLRVAGRIGDFTVYDLEYFFGSDYPGPHMRSVLVEAAGHEFHEILFQESSVSLSTLFPTEIVKAGEQHLIRVKYDDGGMYHYIDEHYFVMLDGVAVLLDFDPVERAAGEAVPNGMSAYQPASGFDFTSMTYSIGTEGPGPVISAKTGCCEGRVTVPFRIEKGLVVAGKAVFDPDWNPFGARRR
jgi:hypothetical protein